VAGVEVYLCKHPSAQKDAENRRLSHLCVLAKNKAGWGQLLRAVSASNHPDRFYYNPRLQLDELAPFAASGDLLAFSGHPGSDLCNVLFEDPKAAYKARTYEAAKAACKEWPRMEADVVALAGKYQEVFGKENFRFEIQLLDAERMPAALIAARVLRRVGKKLGIPCVATPDAHYAERVDARDQRVLLAACFKTTLAAVQSKVDAGEDVTLGGFFQSDNYFVPSAEDLLAAGHTEEELAESLRMTERCEAYKLDGPPLLPSYPLPEGQSPIAAARAWAEENWAGKAGRHGPESAYRARFESELAVFAKAAEAGIDIASYFLLIADIVRHSVRELGCFVTPGRGSGAGSLVGYLMGIHGSDPIEGNLSFERFINPARMTPGKASLPDYDLDFPPDRREPLIKYMKAKYGADRVAKIATFGSLAGRSALDVTLSAHGWGSFARRKAVTELLPSEAAISDKLQEMVEETGDSSVIRYAVEESPDDFRQFASLTEDGEWAGPLGALFAQAERLEGCKRARGTHASGIAVCSRPLAEVCPLMYDAKSKEVLAGMEYPDLEAMGVPKVDILSLADLSRISDAFKLMREGHF
jgi:DNA polymerase-3 subunit alpha